MTTAFSEPMTDAGAVARSLARPEPTREITTDVLILGSGVAGLTAANRLSEAGVAVTVATKAQLRQGSTTWAQGGVATVMSAGDTIESHLEDTLVAGAGLCDPEAVRILVTEGPAAVRELLAAGAVFDGDGHGGLSFTREGGHSHSRIVHAGGDATGLEIQRTLERRLALHPDVRVLEHAFALDLVTDGGGAVSGVLLGMLDDAGRCRSVTLARARAVVLATGGLGQLFACTTNPEVSTGDGVAMALRAGAAVADLEFVQFHPTVFYAGPGALGRQLLISEAVRGEGAYLIDPDGQRVMEGLHPLADLAPRDVVASAIAERMALGGWDHVFLDAREIGEEKLLRRFPTIIARCREAGIDPVAEPIPVAPAAHYSCGGVTADMDGRTSLDGLFAIGEVACTGVHGANRLASNSLLEGLVSARRLAALLADGLGPQRAADPRPGRDASVDPNARLPLNATMSRDVGVLRDPVGLREAAQFLDELDTTSEAGAAAWEATNLHTVATALVAAARLRSESRGCHRRNDWSEPREEWRRHVELSVDPETGGVQAAAGESASVDA
jgi:L-aspartate oxidase